MKRNVILFLLFFISNVSLVAADTPVVPGTFQEITVGEQVTVVGNSEFSDHLMYLQVVGTYTVFVRIDNIVYVVSPGDFTIEGLPAGYVVEYIPPPWSQAGTAPRVFFATFDWNKPLVAPVMHEVRPVKALER